MDVWKTYECKSAVFKMKQVKSKNRNRMAVKSLDDSHRLVNTGIGLLIEDDSVREVSTGADPASKVRGGDFRNIC